MRKILLSLSFVFLLVFSFVAANAQCVPDTQYTSPGIYPDTATGLPDAIATVPYTFVFTVVVPADTNVGGFIVPIDSIGIDNVTGLPPGFSYVTDSESDYWRGDSTGCVLIQGMPQQADVGNHPVTFTVIAKAGGITAPYTVTGYSIEILDSLYAGIPDPAPEAIYAYPNPANDELSLLIDFVQLPGSRISIINSIGQTVASYTTESGQNRLTIPVSGISAGVYTLVYNDGVVRKDMKVIITH